MRVRLLKGWCNLSNKDIVYKLLEDGSLRILLVWWGMGHNLSEVSILVFMVYTGVVGYTLKSHLIRQSFNLRFVCYQTDYKWE